MRGVLIILIVALIAGCRADDADSADDDSETRSHPISEPISCDEPLLSLDDYAEVCVSTGVNWHASDLKVNMEPYPSDRVPGCSLGVGRGSSSSTTFGNMNILWRDTAQAAHESLKWNRPIRLVWLGSDVLKSEGSLWVRKGRYVVMVSYWEEATTIGDETPADVVHGYYCNPEERYELARRVLKRLPYEPR